MHAESLVSVTFLKRQRTLLGCSARDGIGRDGHIWEPIRRSLRSYKEKKSAKVAKDIATKALAVLHRWHPEEIEEHNKTKAHHETIAEARKQTRYAVAIPRVSRDELRAFLNTVHAGVDRSKNPGGGVHQRGQENPFRERHPTVVAKGRQRRPAANLPRERRGHRARTSLSREQYDAEAGTTFGQVLPYGEFRFSDQGVPGLWYRGKSAGQ